MEREHQSQLTPAFIQKELESERSAALCRAKVIRRDTQTSPHCPERGETTEIPQAQYFDKVMGVPSVCQRQEPIITTAQKTVGIPQIQSEEQCRRVTSCSVDCAVRVLMGVRRAWQLQPVGECSASEDNRHSVISTRKGVNPLTKVECVSKPSPWRVEEARVVQPVSTVV